MKAKPTSHPAPEIPFQRSAAPRAASPRRIPVWAVALSGLLLLAAPLSVAAPADSAGPLALIPQPISVATGTGRYQLTAETGVFATGRAVPEARKLVASLAPALGFRLRLRQQSPADKGIGLTLEAALKSRLGEEGYALRVTPERIDLRAAGPAGLFYGIQTLRQLLPSEVLSSEPVPGVDWTVPCVTITDYPRFGWRGLLIDPARHFIPVADVKHFLDAMALHKFNRLQMHLTDNEGWRVEIRKYPRLTEIGSRMDWTHCHGRGSNPRCFGFYTQDDIRELVRYAAERHITIVPEIEMPYHAGAAIVAYPELGVNTAHLTNQPSEKRWRQSRGLLGPRPTTVRFMQDVLAEVIELFPSRFIHIGGDEANLQIWAKDPEMQALLKRLGLPGPHELHSWFIRQMDAFLTAKGRRMVGWDEILQGGLAPGATVMSWRGVKGGITAARAGHDVIMAPTSHTYFDYYQGPRAKEPRAIGGFIPVEKVYEFEPIPPELNAAQARHVLGGQGQLWGEYIATRAHRDYMTWPRACALSETLWSPAEARELEHFRFRLDRHLPRLRAAGVHYREVPKNTPH